MKKSIRIALITVLLIALTSCSFNMSSPDRPLTESQKEAYAYISEAINRLFYKTTTGSNFSKYWTYKMFPLFNEHKLDLSFTNKSEYGTLATINVTLGEKSRNVTFNSIEISEDFDYEEMLMKVSYDAKVTIDHFNYDIKYSADYNVAFDTAAEKRSIYTVNANDKKNKMDYTLESIIKDKISPYFDNFQGVYGFIDEMPKALTEPDTLLFTMQNDKSSFNIKTKNETEKFNSIAISLNKISSTDFNVAIHSMFVPKMPKGSLDHIDLYLKNKIIGTANISVR